MRRHQLQYVPKDVHLHAGPIHQRALWRFEQSGRCKQDRSGDALKYLRAHRPTYCKQYFAPHAFLQFPLNDKPNTPRGRIVPIETRHETDVNVRRLQISRYFVNENRDSQPDLCVVSGELSNKQHTRLTKVCLYTKHIYCSIDHSREGGSTFRLSALSVSQSSRRGCVEGGAPSSSESVKESEASMGSKGEEGGTVSLKLVPVLRPR